jgi:ammonia channel protein AmtB
VTLIYKEKLDMEVMLHATLAGGVAIGASADIIGHMSYSFLIGMLSGTIAACGFLFAASTYA